MSQTYLLQHLKGHFKINTLAPDLIRKVRDELAAEISNRSANVILRTLKAILKTYVGEGFVYNPVDKVGRLGTKTQEFDESDDSAEVITKDKVYSPEELQRVFKSTETFKMEIEVFIKLLALTGIRHGEALALSWDCVDFDAKKIEIKKSWSHKYKDGKPIFYLTKTGSSRRTIDIDDDLLSVLKRWKAQQKIQSIYGLLFCDRHGRPHFRVVPWRFWQRVIKKAGVKYLNLHCLRHTFASVLLMSGVPIPAVSSVLGHAKVNITLSTYSHFIPAMQSSLVAKMSSLISSCSQNVHFGEGNGLQKVG